MNTNPRTELLKKMNKDTEEFLKSKEMLKNDIAIRKMGQLAFMQNTSSLFAPITQSAESQSKVLESISEELKSQSKVSTTSSDRVPTEDIERAIQVYSKIPLIKRTTLSSSNSTSMKVSGTLHGSQLYMLNGKYFHVDTDKLLEIDNETGEILKLHTITPNITEILFNPNPLDKQYTKPELGQYLRILQTTGKQLDNTGEKMKSVLAQLEMQKKPKLKNIPVMGTGVVKFLPSDPKTLLERLFILLGSQQSGNDSQRNEAIAIMDNLLEKGIIDKKKYQSIYNEYFRYE